MKNSLKSRVVHLSVLALSASAGQALAAPDSGKGIPVVYDPLTKKYFIGGTSKFTLKQNDDSGLVDRIEVSVDSGEYQPYKDSLTFKEEGKHTLKFRAVNPVNNWSPVQFIEVFVDLTAPTTDAKFLEQESYKDDKGATYVAQNSLLTLVSQDNLSGIATIEFSWDGKEFAPYSGPIKLTKAGPQTLHFRSSDRVGNAEPVRTISLVTDGNAPTTQVKLGNQAKPAIVNGKSFVSDSVAFSLEASDDTSNVRQTWVEVDGKAPTVYLKPIYFLQEGPHTLTYYSVDNVGNKEKPKSLAVHTVSTPPRTRVTPIGKLVNTGGINYVTQDFQLKLDATDNVVGLERIEVKLDNEGDFKPYLEPIQFKTTGLHTVSYRAIDRAGNIEPTKVFTMDIHLTAPETSIATAQPTVVRNGTVYSPAPNVVTFNVSNSRIGVDKTLVSVNDGPFAPYQGPLTLQNDRKFYKLTYKSVDKLGNEEPAKTVNYQMIGASPVVDLFITNGQSNEEKVRTTYLEQPSKNDDAPNADKAGRMPASTAPAAPKKK
jgi:hypothetical protein